jgi:hypothetical protein
MKKILLLACLLMCGVVSNLAAQTTNFALGSDYDCGFDNQSGISCTDIPVLDANGKSTGQWANFFIVNTNPDGTFSSGNFWLGNYTTVEMQAYQEFSGTVTKAAVCVTGAVCTTIDGKFAANQTYCASPYPACQYQSGTVTLYLTNTPAVPRRPSRPNELNGSGTLSN